MKALPSTVTHNMKENEVRPAFVSVSSITRPANKGRIVKVSGKKFKLKLGFKYEFTPGIRNDLQSS